MTIHCNALRPPPIVRQLMNPWGPGVIYIKSVVCPCNVVSICACHFPFLVSFDWLISYGKQFFMGNCSKINLNIYFRNIQFQIRIAD